MNKSMFFSVCCVGAMLAGARPALAQYVTPNNGMNGIPAPGGTSLPNANSDTIAGAAAHAQQNQADREFTAVQIKLQKQFEASPAFVQASGDLKAAQDAYAVASAAVLGKLKQNNPAYAQALQGKADAEKNVQSLHGDNTTTEPAAGGSAAAGTSAPPSQALTDAAQADLSASQKVTSMEAAALASDPDASKAKAAVEAAGAQVKSLRDQFRVSLTSNPEWVQAKRNIDTADANREANDIR